MALISAIAGWMGLLASLKGETGPIVRAKLIEEKLKVFMSNLTFQEALALYITLVLALTGVTTYGFYKRVKE